MMRRLKLNESYFVSRDIGVITTLGAEGVHYQDKTHDITVKGYSVKKIVDPTGAGDAWRGGFIGALLDGRDIKESLKIANALASFAVEQKGTVNHKPTREQIIERVEVL
jgi:sugar/nucleoside kinase (ribokinase family)